MKIAYSGTKGAFASIAAERIFPGDETVPCSSFAKAYDSVVSGECDRAVIPIENSFAGEVGTVTDLMFNGNLKICGIYEMEIEQCLLGIPGSSEEDIKTVISHPQALEQCGSFIASHGMAIVEAVNTAVAAGKVSEMNDKAVGAIGSRSAAKANNLNVIHASINDSASNVTRFAVFAREVSVNECDDSFILMFTLDNKAGALAGAVTAIGSGGMNMRVIRSRPLKNENWQYFFYTEIEGKASSNEGTVMLENLKKECNSVKIVGSYKSGVAIKEV